MSSLNGFAATSPALGRVSEELARLDAAGLGNPPEAYGSVATTLLGLAGETATTPDWSRSICTGRVGPDPGTRHEKQLTEAVELLHRLSPSFGDPALTRFKAEFGARYEDREVPLMEALDEELGIGFDRSTHPATDESPLLAGLDLGGAVREFGLYRT